MADLTAYLPEQNWTPQPIGGARQSTLLEGLADVGSGIFKAGINATGNAKQQKQASEDVAQDELAMRIFEDKSGLKLGDPGYDQVAFAKKLELAKQNGSISTAVYDVRMQGTVAELMRQNPNNAREIMSDAYNLHGIKDNLFREAALAEDWDKKQRDREATNRQTVLQEAVTTGRYDPTTMDEGWGYIVGMQSLRAKADLASAKAAHDALAAKAAEGDKRAEVEMGELRNKAQRTLMGTLDLTVNGSMTRLSSLLAAAVDDPARKAVVDQELTNALIGLNQLEINGNTFMAGYESQYKDPTTGATRTIGFSQTERDAFKNQMTTYRSMFTQLQGMDQASQERLVKRFSNDAKIAAQKQFPALAGFNEAMGGSWALTLDLLANGTEKLGLDPAVLDSLMKSSADGIDNYLKTSLQNIDMLTKSGSLPVASKDTELAGAAFAQSAQISQVLGAKLAKGDFTGSEDQGVTLDNFKTYFEQLLYGTRKNYTPNMVDSKNATSAASVIFNGNTIRSLDGYLKQGGDKATYDLFMQQMGVAGSTFLEGLKGRYGDKIAFNDEYGMFVPTFKPSSSGGNLGFKIADMMQEAEAKEAASAANSILNNLEGIDERVPIIDRNLVKGSGKTIRQLLGSSKDLKSAFEYAAKQAKDKLAEGSANLFDKAVQGLTDPSKDMWGGVDVNPFDNIDMSSAQQSAMGGDMIDKIFQREGGYVADDNGAGPTKFGINEKAHPNVDIQNLSQDEARTIYQSDYLAPVIQAGVPANAQEAVLDAAVNQGVKTALDLWEASKGDLKRFVELRLKRYAGTKVNSDDPQQEAQIRESWKRRAYESAGLTEGR
jgi:hypothetical protein